MTEIKPVAWVERTEDGHDRMWSGDLSAWANRPANPEPLYDQATVDVLVAENERLRQELVDAKEARQWLQSALEHIVRVAMGARKQTTRLAWIIQRAKSELSGDSLWQEAKKPAGYHNALERR